MNLRRVAVMIDGAAGIARAASRAIESFERVRRYRTGAVIAFVGAGVAIGALATSPELRKQVRAWFAGVGRDEAEATHANGAALDGATEYATSG